MLVLKIYQRWNRIGVLMRLGATKNFSIWGRRIAGKNFCPYLLRKILNNVFIVK